MAIGDLVEVETGSCEDLHFLDVGMYDTPEYGGVYVLDAERPAVVETGLGTRAADILDAMARVGIAPEDLDVVAVTHVHLDHAGGAGHLARACENAEVVVHETGAPHLADPSRLVEGTKAAVEDQWQYYDDPIPVPHERIREVTDGDVVDLGDHELRVHHAPGHAPHQVVFEDPANDAVFAADAAGIYVPQLDDVVQTTPPAQFHFERALTDVDLLRELAPETLLFTHFGSAETDGLLDRYEAVLSEWVADVEAAREELGDDEAVIERFQRETEMGDVWSERKARAETRLNTRGVLGYLDYRDRDD
ncbi:MBL fold metallo-hydrolase [Halomarina oriensis]|uniref:MBL fold metallo-hydrolase n=1 Tax=Halomarina oriensis TaxID=671145 RepID=A0A6B0GI46_9EURY|nr:MBL fold metallo-hydrolase [Halomarina oriensis]MWG34290.1 MBL fold metallo-hydrolase [Halomarina oriensis]